MTTRERIEKRLERRRQWAEKRREHAAALLERNAPFRGDIAFNTQPGHIPERARVIAREDRAIEHEKMAQHHESKADGLEHELETCIFSDDPDAVQELEAKAAALEAQRDRAKAINAAWKHEGSPAAADDEGWQRIAARIGPERLAEARGNLVLQPYHNRPFPAYVLTNLGARIRDAKQRVEAVQKRQARAAAAAEAPGGVIVTRHPAYNACVVTFAQKPAREVLDALKAAGYWWHGGSWQGPADRLPPGIQP